MTKLRIACTFLAWSTLPVLLSIALIYLSPGAHGSDYWAVAPWLVVVAIAATPVWMIVLAIGLVFLVRKKGVRPSTLKHENAVVLAVVAIVVGIPVGGYAFMLWQINRSLQMADADVALGYRHLESSEEVSRQFHGPYLVKSDRRQRDRDDNGVRRLGYIVAADENGLAVRYFAVVDVVPGSSGRQARLACMRPVDYWVNQSPTWDRECDGAP